MQLLFPDVDVVARAWSIDLIRTTGISNRWFDALAATMQAVLLIGLATIAGVVGALVHDRCRDTAQGK
jgi:hypothetical protein